MNSHVTAWSPHTTRRRGRLLAVVCAAWLAVGLAPDATATLNKIGVIPEHPTVCAPVALSVEGTMPDPCHHIIGAVVEGPTELPTMGPIPTYEIRVRITVQEPNPDLDIACPTVLQPYERTLRVGFLRFGHYIVNATEYLVPFTSDSTAAPKDSSQLSTRFEVASENCPPGLGCFMLGFGTTLALSDPTSIDGCDARVRPGGTACFDVTLSNETPVGGVQTEIVVYDPRANAPTPIASELFQPTSVVAAGRAADFKVAWTAEGSRAKILLFSADGAAIEPGRGAILHVCYSVAARAPEGRYSMRHQNVVVADPAGNAMRPCPTFAEIVGTICVFTSAGGCDLNGDGVSNIQDVILLAHCALRGSGTSNACPDSVAAKADCNGDGTVDIRDVICCVRRILDGGFGTGGGSGPGPPGGTRIGFAGRPSWVDPETGQATIEIEQGIGFGGIQFAVNPTGEARILELRLLSAPTNVALDWKTALKVTLDTESPPALAMIYRTDPTGSSVPSGAPGAAVEPIRVAVTFQRTTGSQGAVRLSLGGVVAATSTGGAAGASIEMGSVSLASSPAVPSVSAAAPNPFALETAITYTLPTAQRVTIRVYNVSGRLVRTLVDAAMPVGTHTAAWNGQDAGGRELGSGIYFVKFAAGTVEKTDRVLKLR